MTCTRTLVVVGLLAGCKLETVQELPVFEEKPLLDTDVRLVPASEPLDEAKALVEAELRRQLSALTSPYLAGRRPGSEGATLTAGHLERTMLELGLSPAGVGGGWRQPVVVRIRAIDDARVELPGATPDAEPEILRHGEGMVVWRVEGSGGTWSHAHPVVDAGFGITAPDLAYDDYAAVDVKGKIVLVRDGVPAEGFEGDAAQDYGSRDYKLERARRVGAAGCLFATGLLRSDAAWQSQVEELRAPLIEASAEGSAHGPGIAVAGVLSADAEAKLRAWLAAASAAEGPSRAATVVGTTTERTVVDPNIIGRIPGHDRPEEVIVVLAHWDAGRTGPALPEGGAARDNATGVAALLAMARKSTDWVRRGRRPSRSIAFVATASDSLDLAGTRALLEAGPLRRSQVVAVVALDALSVRSGGPALAGLGLDASALGTDVLAVRPDVRPLEDGQGPHWQLPHVLALAAAIPAVTLTRHDPEAAHEDVRDDPGSNHPDLAEDVRLVFDVVWGLAESNRVPALTETGDDEDPAVEP